METEPVHSKTYAIDLLLEEHEKIREFFREFEETEDTLTRKYVADIARVQMRIYMVLIEEYFYPQAQKAVGFQAHIAKGMEEHHVIKLLISELQALVSADQGFVTKFRVLGDTIMRHIQEQESEFFPVVELSDLDLFSLGCQMKERKKRLIEDGLSRSEAKGASFQKCT